MKLNKQKRSKIKGFAEIFGTHAVYAALNNPNRKHEKLFVSQNQKEDLSKELGKLIPDINELHNKEMFKMFGNESTHQGIVLRTSKLEQPSLESFIKNSKEKGLTHIVVNGDKNNKFLNDVFYNEEKYPYLIKKYDSLNNGFKIQIKVYEIDYIQFKKFYAK